MRHILYILLLCFSAGYASAQCTPIINTSSGNNFICNGGAAYLDATPGDTYQWYLNGVPITSATDDHYIANIPGSYTVEVDSVGCVATSAPLLLTANSSPDTPGTITCNDAFCEGTTQTFSIDPVPGANRYSWYSNGQTNEWGDLYDDSTNVATIVVGASAQNLSPNTIISVAAINECGATQSDKTVSVHSPHKEGSYGSNPDFLGSGQGTYCPRWDSAKIHVSIMAGTISGYLPPVTFQWCLDGIPLAGETGMELTIHNGGNYSVQVAEGHCGILTVPKLVHQDVPSSITITPQGPLNFCQNNAQALSVSFDMTGVDGDFEWTWYKGSSTHFERNVYSLIPDTMGYYNIWGEGNGSSGQCLVMYPNPVYVTIPPPLEVTQTDDTLFATPGYDTYQWYESGTLLPGETNQKLVLTVDGFYTVEGVFMNGCVENSLSFDPVFMPPPPPPPPGTNSQQPNDQMTVSPNPAGSSFVLNAKIAPQDTKATIIITDATGRAMFEKEIDVVDGIVEEKIELGDASASMGIIKLRSAHTLNTTKFFKK